jgi:c-di-GMP-binding flagellar brake protein YcgR
MDLKKCVNIGDRIEITKLDKNKLTVAYSSKLVEIEKDEIIVEAPISEGILVPLKVEDKFDIYFNTKNGFYLVTAQLKERKKSENSISTLKFLVVSKVSKVQRREYFRFDCLLDAKMRKMVENFDTPFEECLIKDISAGGIRFNCMSELEKGDIVECIIDLEENGINCVGEVVRVLKVKDNYKYQIGINFINLKNQDRDSIFRYIFNQQRKLIKKGMV